MGATDQSMDRLSRDEIQCLFENFSDADWVRAKKSARILAHGLIGVNEHFIGQCDQYVLDLRRRQP